MRFQKGQSGNPGGRARGYHEFAQACRDVSHKGVKQVLEIAENKKNHPVVRSLPGRRSGSVATAGRCSLSL